MADGLEHVGKPHYATFFQHTNKLLKRDGVHVVVGCIEPLSGATNIGPMVVSSRTLAGSVIGVIAVLGAFTLR